MDRTILITSSETTSSVSLSSLAIRSEKSAPAGGPPESSDTEIVAPEKDANSWRSRSATLIELSFRPYSFFTRLIVTVAYCPPCLLSPDDRSESCPTAVDIEAISFSFWRRDSIKRTTSEVDSSGVPAGVSILTVMSGWSLFGKKSDLRRPDTGSKQASIKSVRTPMRRQRDLSRDESIDARSRP